MNLLFVQMAVRIGGHVNFLSKNLDFPVIPDFQGSKKLKKEEEKHGFNQLTVISIRQTRKP